MSKFKVSHSPNSRNLYRRGCIQKSEGPVHFGRRRRAMPRASDKQTLAHARLYQCELSWAPLKQVSWLHRFP